MPKVIDKKNIPQVWKDHDRSIRKYTWSHKAIAIGSNTLGLFLLVFLLRENRFAMIELKLNESVANPFLHWLIYFGFLGVFWEVLSFPFAVAQKSPWGQTKWTK